MVVKIGILVYKERGGEGANIHGRNSSLIFPKVVLVTTEPYITSDIYGCILNSQGVVL